MDLKLIEGNFKWRCQKGKCNEKLSVRANTWLEGSNLNFATTLQFIYCWTKEYTSVKFCNDELQMGKNQTIDYCSYMREICAFDIMNNPVMIGGPGTTVEIDETLYSRRKYNRGRQLPEQWVFGGICRETKECFLYAVPNRTRETLFSCITANIKPRTKILSDCWRAYGGIGNLEGFEFEHLTVNHSENFVDTDTGAHTQMIESLWHTAKRRNQRQCGTHRQMVDGYLCEFMWRQRQKNENLFDLILDLLCDFPNANK